MEVNIYSSQPNRIHMNRTYIHMLADTCSRRSNFFHLSRNLTSSRSTFSITHPPVHHHPFHTISDVNGRIGWFGLVCSVTNQDNVYLLYTIQHQHQQRVVLSSSVCMQPHIMLIRFSFSFSQSHGLSFIHFHYVE